MPYNRSTFEGRQKYNRYQMLYMRRIREEIYESEKPKGFSKFALTVFPHLADVDPEEYFDRRKKNGRPRGSYTRERNKNIRGRTIEIAPGRRGVIVSRDKRIASE
jgi:hypothetical protein